jgi:hypothetical protein
MSVERGRHNSLGSKIFVQHENSHNVAMEQTHSHRMTWGWWHSLLFTFSGLCGLCEVIAASIESVPPKIVPSS